MKKAGTIGGGIEIKFGAKVTQIPADFCYSRIDVASTVTRITFAEDSACERIGANAFRNCRQLTSIVVPERMVFIADTAFINCNCLVEICNKSSLDIIAGELDYGRIGYNAFDIYTTEQESKVSTDNDGYIVYSDGSEKILIGYIYENVTELVVPNDITKVNKRAFWNWNGLTSVIIGESVTDIGDEAFASCGKITGVTFGENVKNIGNGAFRGCAKLTNVYITDIAAWCEMSWHYAIMYDGYSKSLYLNGELITDLIIPDSATCIDDYAFYNCNNLTSVTIGNGVTDIGRYAFFDCKNITNVTIGESVKNIGAYAFSNCPRLTELNYNAIECNDSTEDKFIFVSTYGGGMEVTIGENVTKIPAYLFAGADSFGQVESLTFAENSVCESIGDFAFYDCEKMTSVIIGNRVKYIGEKAFYGCNRLNSVTIGKKVESIGYDAFYECPRLTEIYITDIAAWCRISKLYNLMTEESEKSLYYHDELIVNLVIPDSVTKISEYAFYNCDGIESVTMGTSVIIIDDCAFAECRNLESATIGAGVTEIGAGIFEDCESLTDLTFVDTTTWYKNNVMGNEEIDVTSPSKNAESFKQGNQYLSKR